MHGNHLETTQVEFFSTVYRHRTASTFLAAVCFGAVAALFIWKGGTEPLLFWVGVPMGGFATLVGAAALSRWLKGDEEEARITKRGIEQGSNSWTWSEISWLGGRFDSGGVEIWFVPTGRTLGQPILTNEPLTDDEFQLLIERLEQFLNAKHPNVHVERKPMQSFG